MPSSDSDDPIGLKAAADQLGVHYMTAYRYVRTGRLRAKTVRGEWQVAAEDLQRFQTAPVAARGQSRERRIQQMMHCLVAGDELAADSVSDAILAAGCDPEYLYLEVLAPALSRIGEQWAKGELSVADEHRASTCAQRLIGRFGPRFVPRGRHRGTALLAAPAGDRHGLPVTMIADLLRHRGVETIDLGADLPTDAITRAAQKVDRLGVVGLCVTTPGTTRALRATIAAIHDELDGVAVALGGSAVTARMARDLGADRFCRGGRDALAVIALLATSPRHNAPPDSRDPA